MGSTSQRFAELLLVPAVKTNESYVAQVFSDWTDTFSTELKASYREYSAVREVPTNARASASTSARWRCDHAGRRLAVPGYRDQLAEQRWKPRRGTTTPPVPDIGDHDLKFGGSYDTNDVYNYYGAGSWGAYTFYGLDNFAKGKWQTYQLNKERSANSIAADYKYSNLACSCRTPGTSTAT
jgi:hypothetical protein